ncbi:MAG: 30S ribosomal protein S13 [archaeon]|nr:30S ribosomal protein S13 [archaeon]
MVEKEPKKQVDEENFNFIVRIADSDIDGQKSAVIGIQQIKGVGKRVAHIVVKRTGINPITKIGSLADEDVKKLEESVTTYAEYVPEWVINRQLDYETGADMHLIGSNLEIVQKDDINRMKMIRCYRGIRHETHHKVRGQRTRSNGRHGLTMGVSKKKA